MKKLDALVDSMNSFQKEMKAQGEKVLKETFAELFEKHRTLLGFCVTGYAPHFNDGDACTFSVHDLKYRRLEDGEEFDPEDEDAYEHEVYHYGEEKKGLLFEDMKNLSSSLQNLDTILRSVFGDDFLVCVTREKIYVQDYSGEHD